MIDERADRNLLCELDDAAIVIGMEVRDQEIVDLLEPGFPDRSHDAVRVARVIAGVARVDQQRFAGRRRDQRRLTTFDVDE